MKTIEKKSLEVDDTKRQFMKKFGGYAATAPVGMYMLMTPSSSAAQQSGCGQQKMSWKQTKHMYKQHLFNEYGKSKGKQMWKENKHWLHKQYKASL